MRIEELEARAYLSAELGGARVYSPGFLSPIGGRASAAEIASEPLIAFTLELTGENGAELTRDDANRYVVVPGASYRVNVYVDDLREAGAAGGVYSAYANLTTDASADELQFESELSFGPGFNLEQAGIVQPTALSNVGSLRDSLSAPGSDPRQLLFSVEQQVGAGVEEGSVFMLDLEAGDVPSDTKNLVFGEEERAAGSYQDVELVVIERPWRNVRDPVDVNDDGKVSARDVLNIINSLLASGGAFDLGVPTVAARRFYYDVNGDGACSAEDYWQLVDFLLARQAVATSPVSPLASPRSSPKTASDSDSDEAAAHAVSAAIEDQDHRWLSWLAWAVLANPPLRAGTDVS